jgi:hypothetical protein
MYYSTFADCSRVKIMLSEIFFLPVKFKKEKPHGVIPEDGIAQHVTFYCVKFCENHIAHILGKLILCNWLLNEMTA